MRLALLHPRVAARSCQECQQYLYNEDGTPVCRGRGPERVRVARLPTEPTPCHKCPKIPEGHPDPRPSAAVEMDERLWRAYWHYLECKAVASFPDDPIVRRNAGLIRSVEDALGPARQTALLESLIRLFAQGGGRGA